MKVLMITVRADHGGGPRHIELLLKHLPSTIEVHVACPCDFPYSQRFYGLTLSRVFEIPHRKFDWRSVFNLVRYVRSTGIDLIHAHGKGAGLYGRIVSAIVGIPLIYTPHGINVVRRGSMAWQLYRYYENWTSKWIKYLIFVSNEELEFARSVSLWSDVPHVVINNGTESCDLKQKEMLRLASRGVLGASDDQLIVVTLSRFDRQKNMSEAFDVARKLPNYLFLWIGEGDDYEGLQKRAIDEKVNNVRFMGKQEDATGLLAASDIYFTSALWEGLPFAVLEAMSVGLPIVASDVIGHREVVGSRGCGLLYSSGDTSQACNHILRLANDASLRKQLGEQGCRAQDVYYSSRRMTESVVQLYQMLSKACIN